VRQSARPGKAIPKRRFLIFMAGAALAGASAARAQEVTPAPAPPPADCSLADAADARRILGYAVSPADEASRAGGICFYPSSDASQEGSVSYAVVTAARLPQRNGFYAALARRCGSVAPGAPRAFACATFVKLALAKNLDDYFAARTGSPGASPVPGLGFKAVATEDALYVRRPDAVVEAIVRRGTDFDLDRATELAKLLLARLDR
jgi:hypothetical protein